jgi:small-conductance mechanosensitive channel
MRQVLALAACLVVAFGCQKKAEQPAGSSPAAAQPAAAAAAKAQPSATTTAPVEPRRIEITDDLVQKYMEYEKTNLALLTQYVEDTRKNLDSAKGDTAKTLQQLTINEKMSKDLDEKLKAKRASLGLGDEEFNAVKDGADMVALGRMAYTQMGGDAQMAKIQAQQKKQIAALPEAQRQAAEASLSEVSKSLTDLRDAAEVRKKYGDKSADALLKHADELAAQRLDALKLLGAKK